MLAAVIVMSPPAPAVRPPFEALAPRVDRPRLWLGSAEAVPILTAPLVVMLIGPEASAVVSAASLSEILVFSPPGIVTSPLPVSAKERATNASLSVGEKTGTKVSTKLRTDETVTAPSLTP